jgi:hypothetical protein
MKPEYRTWVRRNYPNPESAELQCVVAARRMVAAFPELREVRGFVKVNEPYDCPPTSTTHVWCVSPDGEIVDPTVHQYPFGVCDYLPFDPNRVPTCRPCPNCSEPAYQDTAPLCSPKCRAEYEAYLNS